MRFSERPHLSLLLLAQKNRQPTAVTYLGVRRQRPIQPTETYKEEEI